MLLDAERAAELEKALNYKFKNIELFEQAFIHPSNDALKRQDYQRLEFLGDEVVGLAVSTMLFKKFPEAEEGQLSKARANLIDELGLASISRSLNLSAMLLLGKGEDRHGGREKESIAADVFESLMAVIYMESGWIEAFRIIENIFEPLISGSRDIDDLLAHINRDYKTRLQEIVQELDLPLPDYKVVEKVGPEHETIFTIECNTMSYCVKGVGKNKKSAEQDAARKILIEMRLIKE